MNKNNSKNLMEASWELFMETGDPFYIIAKNTFKEKELTIEKENRMKNLKAKQENEDENSMSNF